MYVLQMVVGFFVFAYSDPRFGAWWAGQLPLRLLSRAACVLISDAVLSV